MEPIAIEYRNIKFLTIQAEIDGFQIDYSMALIVNCAYDPRKIGCDCDARSQI